MEARGRALNQRYSLGQYAAPRHGVDVKKWAAIGVALAAMVAALLTAVVLVRRASHRAAPRVPEICLRAERRPPSQLNPQRRRPPAQPPAATYEPAPDSASAAWAAASRASGTRNGEQLT